MQRVVSVHPGATLGRVRRTGPKLGQHNDEVCEKVLGFGVEGQDGQGERVIS